jgi:hypothetical protein
MPTEATMRRWLARLSFSFLALAFVLAWQGWRHSSAGAEGWRVAALYLGAALCLAAGLAGVRERHRH